MGGGSIVERLKLGVSWRSLSMKSRKEGEDEEVQVVDGSGITNLVMNEEAFTKYVDNKFKELDLDQDGMLSEEELQPAVADIGAGLGLPARGSCPDSDHIYSFSSDLKHTNASYVYQNCNYNARGP